MEIFGIVITTRKKLILAHTLWNSDTRDNPDMFLAKEQVNELSVGELSEDQVGVLLNYLRKV